MLDYRSDVDGLRAVAVLPVLLYHFGIWPFSGGFVGVDVFFVISGYVITLGLSRQIAEGKFSIVGFYDRRIRRILPALIVVVVTSLVLGYFLLLPSDFESLGQQALWSAGGFGNFYFLFNTGYFDRASDLLPLLHMWSLGVEEQFYFFWPMLLFCLSRLGGKAVTRGLLVIIAVSFALSVYYVQENAPVAFYMLYTRAWELALGAILVYAPTIRGRRTNETLALIGIGLIAYAIFMLDEKDSFPGLNALWPCAGAALMIWTRGTFVARVLSLRPAVFIGLISYSLYLWHWPVVVFFRIWANGVRPNFTEAIYLCLVSVALAWLSYRFVERPFRAGHDPKTQRSPIATIAVGLLSIAVVAGAGAMVWSSGGLPIRLPETAQHYASFMKYHQPNSDKLRCEFNETIHNIKLLNPRCLIGPPDRPNVLLIGDSHAGHFHQALRQTYPDVNFSRFISTGCRPLLAQQGQDYCTRLMGQAFEKLIPEGKFDAIILSGRWRFGQIDKMSDTIRFLKKYTNQVVVFGQTMEYRDLLPAILLREYMPRRHQSIGSLSLYRQMKEIDVALAGYAKDADYRSVIDVICPNGKCALTLGETPFQNDQDHLTFEGAAFVVGVFKNEGLSFGRQSVATSRPQS
jgi:peptidoglycan/LPS O-acetylase OafA/YrhL